MMCDKAEADYQTVLMDFVYKQLDSWEKDNGKGLSDFITDRMIESMLEDDDFRAYRRILSSL